MKRGGSRSGGVSKKTKIDEAAKESARFTDEFKDELIETARKIASAGRGILAADESTGTIGKRFSGISVENVEANRRAYRELLITTPDWGKHVSGIILFEETLFQKSAAGVSFVETITKAGVVPGIKVDKGLAVIPCTGENVTMGLDGLGTRCADYYKAGARFSKWRAVFNISPSKGLPSPVAVTLNAQTLAQYAAISQANGLVPIVEPEVLMEGDHTLIDCEAATSRVLAAVFKALDDQGILLEGCLLKPNMVTPGISHPDYKATSPMTIANATCRTLARHVPPSLPGIMFLSGGQSEDEASANLNAINQFDAFPCPWSLSFSYGRALQASCLKAWKGDSKNVAAAQQAFLQRALANGQAQLGKLK